MGEAAPIKVCIRSRPFNGREISENAQKCVRFDIGRNQVTCSGRMFTFDSVVDENTHQEAVFELCGLELIEKFFKGFNCTILAYGQTGSGKTYTMGTEETKDSLTSESRGLVPRLVEKLFLLINTSENESTYSVYVSMLELYENVIVDLLSMNPNRDSKDLAIREQNGLVFIPGLQRVKVGNILETMAQLEKGCQHRSKGSTAMNATSSRSHAIFTIFVDKIAANEDDTAFSAKLNLVDLAGSERLKKTQAEGERMREGIRINEALSHLGNVIELLAEGTQKHIPYRNSKLTRLLQDSLGGNAHTAMIACISPADTNSDETIHTLNYADKAKKIKNKPVVNEDSNQREIRELRAKVRELQSENGRLREGISPEEIAAVEKMARAENDTGTQSSAVVGEVIILKETLQRMKEERDEATRMAIGLSKLTTNLEQQVHKMEEDREKVRKALEEEGTDGITETLRQIIEDNNVANESQTGAGGDEAMDTDVADEEEDMDDETRAQEYMKKQMRVTSDIGRCRSQIVADEGMLRDARDLDRKMDGEVKRLTDQCLSLQDEVDRMTKEREDLLRKTKAGEEHRRRNHDLDSKVKQLKTIRNTLEKISNEKKEQERKISKLNEQLVKQKQEKVSLMKQLRAEGDRFHKTEQKIRHEMLQLVKQERKRNAEMDRRVRKADQKASVLESRMAEAKRAKKRLEEQLASATTRRLKENPTNMSKLGQEIRKYLQGELQLYETMREAHEQCEQLMSSRKELNKTLTNLKDRRAKLDQPSKKKRLTDGGESEDVQREVQKQVLDVSIADSQARLDALNTELRELQENAAKSDMDARADSRFASVKTLQYAITALQTLFDLATDRVQEVVTLRLAHQMEKGRLRDEVNRLKKAMERKDEEIDAAHNDCESLRTDVHETCHRASKQIFALLVSKECRISPEMIETAEHLHELYDTIVERYQCEGHQSSPQQSAVPQPLEKRVVQQPARYGKLHTWTEEDSIAYKPKKRSTCSRKKTPPVFEDLSPIRDCTIMEASTITERRGSGRKRTTTDSGGQHSKKDNEQEPMEQGDENAGNATFVINDGAGGGLNATYNVVEKPTFTRRHDVDELNVLGPLR